MQMLGSRPINFTGTFRLAIDSKTKRLTIPAKWRPQPDQDFYVVPNPNGCCLSVFTPEEYQKAVAKIDALPSMSESDKASAKRLLGARTRTAFCDAQGRVVLDAAQLQWAGISTKAVLIGRVSNFEIWAPEKWKDIESLSAPSLDGIAKLVGL